MRRPLFFLTLLALIGALTACKRDYQAEARAYDKPEAHPVETQELRPAVEPMPVEASGTLVSKTEATLSFKIGGVIERIPVEKGQAVRKGQALARLHLAEIDAQVAKARQAVEKAERDLARVERLLADSAATLEQAQDSRTALEVARSDLRIAEFNREYAVVRAPMAGKVLDKYAEAGELTSPGAPVLRLGSVTGQALALKVGVADRDVVRLAEGDSASLEFDAHPGETFWATVTEIAAAAHPRTGAYEVELTLAPTRLMLKNGFIARAKVFPSRQAPYYRVPTDALVEASEGTASLFLERDGKARRVEVRPLRLGEGYFAIDTTGLPTGAVVVSSGASYLREGTPLAPQTSSR